MIKLFWNTHNQKNNPNDKEDRDYIWGLYHKDNSNKWIYEILKKIQYQKIDNEEELQNDDTLIIVDSSVEKKNDLYTKLKLICSKMFLIQLGDESGAYDLSSIYNNFNHVWRTFCSNKYFKRDKISCFPIGYKSGVKLNKELTERKYKWAFIGTPHKSSRHDLLFQLCEINPFFSYKTEKFNKKILSIKEMNDILSSSKFIPCPNGFVHPETYRLYEALECECIPIVENAYKYYDRLFPNNPFIKIDKWVDAKIMVRDWNENQIKKKREECKLWWKDYKIKLQKSFEKIINHE